MANMDSALLSLNVAESISKMIPIVGNLIEGACATVRKIMETAQVCELLGCFPMISSYSPTECEVYTCRMYILGGAHLQSDDGHNH